MANILAHWLIINYGSLTACITKVIVAVFTISVQVLF